MKIICFLVQFWLRVKKWEEPVFRQNESSGVSHFFLFFFFTDKRLRWSLLQSYCVCVTGLDVRAHTASWLW